MAPASSKEFLHIQATVECGFTLKRVRDMIKTYNQMNVKGSLSSNEETVKVLGITVENKLSLEQHLNEVCKKVGQKIHALARVSKFILQKKLEGIMRAFIISQFSYCL